MEKKISLTEDGLAKSARDQLVNNKFPKLNFDRMTIILIGIVFYMSCPLFNAL